jgi:hypothetical protein
MLSSSFRCDQIHNRHRYHLGHTLLCYLSRTLMFNEPASEAGLLNKRSCLAPALVVTKFIIVGDMSLVSVSEVTVSHQSNMTQLCDQTYNHGRRP